jgi:hypothetical protein
MRYAMGTSSMRRKSRAVVATRVAVGSGVVSVPAAGLEGGCAMFVGGGGCRGRGRCRAEDCGGVDWIERRI